MPAVETAPVTDSPSVKVIASSLDNPPGLAFRPEGALIRIAPDGSRETILDEGLVSPARVAVSNDGAIYVTKLVRPRTVSVIEHQPRKGICEQ